MSTTPSTEEAPESISVLFARDPMGLSDQNIEQIVQYFRESRSRFVAGDIKAGSEKTAKAKPAAKPPKETKAIEGLELDLGDLGL